MLPETINWLAVWWAAAALWGVANHVYMHHQISRVLSDAEEFGIEITPQGYAVLGRDRASEFDRAVGKAFFALAGIGAVFGGDRRLVVGLLFFGLVYWDITSGWRWWQRRRVLTRASP